MAQKSLRPKSFFQPSFSAKESAPTYVIALAIMLGGVALVLPELSLYLSSGLIAYVASGYLLFAILGAILGFFWPQGGWVWGLWLVLPLFTLNCINAVAAYSPGLLLDNLLYIVKIVIAGCASSFITSRLSPRRLR